MLIRAGAVVDVKDEDGHTALYDALSNGGEDCAELLLDAGAKMCQQTQKVLLNARADVGVRDDDGYTALLLAAWMGYIECLKVRLSCMCCLGAGC